MTSTLNHSLAYYTEAARSQLGPIRPDDPDDADFWDGLTAVADALAARLPGDEWVLVPREPTDRMCTVGITRHQEFADDHDVWSAKGEREQFRAVWAAMIAATPTASPAAGIDTAGDPPA